MKKLLIMALVAASATTAFAQGDVALKSILKSKDYTEASGLLQSNLSTLNDEQKAKAYNKLVELSMKKVDAEMAVISGNQVKASLGQQADPVDNAGLYASLTAALKDAMECDKYDNLPNAKGKVAPKFHKTNSVKLWPLRVNLINAGQDATQKEDGKAALANYGLYVESGVSPLFSDIDKTQQPDTYLGEVARVAAVYAFQEKDLDLSNKYCDISLTDTASYKDALSLKMYLVQQTLKTREDSLKCVETFEGLYAKDKENEVIFTNLANLYSGLGQKEKQAQFIQQRIDEYPNTFNAWALRGQNKMNESKWDEAIADYKKALEIDPDKSIILTFLGFTINSKAAELNDVAQQKELYTESMKYLEHAKEVDPSRQEANWTYPLYQCYYSLFGAEDSRTQEIEAYIK